MTRRSLSNNTDRFFSVLIYLFAIYDTLFFSIFAIDKLPIIIQKIIIIPATPIIFIYGILGNFIGRFAPFLVFMILFLAIVQNKKIHHFLRFNTLQTIIFGILLFLLGLIFSWLLMPIFGQDNILIQTLFNAIFISGLGACWYSMFRAAQGIYPQLPIISKEVYHRLY